MHNLTFNFFQIGEASCGDVLWLWLHNSEFSHGGLLRTIQECLFLAHIAVFQAIILFILILAELRLM